MRRMILAVLCCLCGTQSALAVNPKTPASQEASPILLGRAEVQTAATLSANTMSWQGQLTDGSGTPLSGPHTFTFRVFDALTGGTLHWEETSALTASNGIVDAVLGSVTPLSTAVFDGNARWLEVEVDGNILSPRKSLDAVPYAFWSTRADTADVALSGGSGGSVWSTDGTDVWRTTGGVGVGTDQVTQFDSGVNLHVSEGNIMVSDSTDAPDLTLNILSPQNVADVRMWKDGVSTSNLRFGTDTDGATLNFQDRTGPATTRFSINGLGRVSIPGQVGIGTSSPGRLLDVAGDVELDDIYGNDTAGPMGIYAARPTGAAFRIYTKGAGGAQKSRMEFESGTDVDAVTFTSATNVTVQGNLTVNGTLTAPSVNDGDWEYFTSTRVGTDKLVGIGIGNTTPVNSSLHVEGTWNGINPLVRITNLGTGSGMLIRTGSASGSGPAIQSESQYTGVGGGIGVAGITRSQGHSTGSAVGVKGEALSTTANGGSMIGVLGKTYLNSNTGVSLSAGVQGQAVGQSNPPVAHDGRAVGVIGDTWSRLDNMFGVRGSAEATTGRTYGVIGQTNSTSTGASGIRGVAFASSGTTYGVYGESQSPNGYAGYFEGDVKVTGTLSKTGSVSKIDHPLDPMNRNLNHFSIESPDMKNIYDGMVTLDGEGDAWVALPEWFEALNRNFRYQLTPIGAAAPNLHVSEPINNNRFQVSGGVAQLKVSWQVTGIRHDPFAEANRIPIEEDKSAEERGHYLHPSAYGVVDSR